MIGDTYNFVNKMESDFWKENGCESEDEGNDRDDCEDDIPEPEHQVNLLVDNILSEHTNSIASASSPCSSN